MLSDASAHKRLIVLRHGKAAYPPVPDHERPLAQRGIQEAPAAGWFRLWPGSAALRSRRFTRAVFYQRWLSTDSASRKEKRNG